MASPYNSAQSIRVKRFRPPNQMQTFFVTCDENDPISSVKLQLIHILKQHKLIEEPEDPDMKLSAEDIQLYIKNRLLEDDVTCLDQQVFDNGVVYLVLKDEKTNDWEQLDVVANQHFEYDYPPKVGDKVKA